MSMHFGDVLSTYNKSKANGDGSIIVFLIPCINVTNFSTLVQLFISYCKIQQA